MADKRPDGDDRVEILFRNGTITVVGIVVAFSLVFLTQWASNPIPWQQSHLVAVAPIIIGIALQMKALADLMRQESLRRSVHDRAVRFFMIGLVVTFAGVGAAIVLDVTQLADGSAL
ncbi:hypothetical protein [Mesorhizobium sp. KR9-304]|uniref:hypothetical protein n=1 Tax=Mesorhizobium sp. KR9-304 TaxID=3156614 RepID=UPI0032B311BE